MILVAKVIKSSDLKSLLGIIFMGYVKALNRKYPCDETRALLNLITKTHELLMINQVSCQIWLYSLI